MSANIRRYFTPWALSLPGTVLFVSLLLIPMLMTVVLSFNVYDADLGAVPDKYTIAHYLKVLGDSYYYEIFFRTYWISLCVALICVIIGVPEAYIISRMQRPWRSIMLLANWQHRLRSSQITRFRQCAFSRSKPVLLFSSSALSSAIPAS